MENGLAAIDGCADIEDTGEEDGDPNEKGEGEPVNEPGFVPKGLT